MTILRRHFIWIIGAWLLCQSSVMILVPVSLCAASRLAAAEQTCTCAHADGPECPMHHTKTKTSQKSCSCRSTTDVPTAILVSLTGSVAILTSETTVAATNTTSSLPAIPGTILLNASINPDPPPPRA
jgi:hypothetical protein